LLSKNDIYNLNREIAFSDSDSSISPDAVINLMFIASLKTRRRGEEVSIRVKGIVFPLSRRRVPRIQQAAAECLH